MYVLSRKILINARTININQNIEPGTHIYFTREM